MTPAARMKPSLPVGPTSSLSSSGRVPLQSRNPNKINGTGGGGGLGGSNSSLGVGNGTFQGQGSFSSRGGGNSSTEEYTSKDMGTLNRLSTLESSHNENNKRLTSSTSCAGQTHMQNNQSGARSNNNSLQNSNIHNLPTRRNSANDIRDGSDPGVPTAAQLSAAARPKIAQRSNSVPILNDASSNKRSGGRDGGDDVIIEEKRRNLNGEGYTVHRYLRGRMLGKGGFAKVYLCTALDTNKAYAIKIVPKANLVKARARQKLQAEIKIHRTLKHTNVCEYKHFFEDRQNCYILLELCHNQSMNEMIKRRKRITEPETAYLMHQLLHAVKYMHAQLVIHRDLKLGNLFLDKNTNIKVGDLGLATRLESADEKRKTICGTPNYIAPEVIQGDRATRGHSFEVDVWSMGVIMFTCLCGKPPYEAKDVKATYQRILANEYSFPRDVAISEDARKLICSMLQSKPADRPSLDEIGMHPFFMARPLLESMPSNATHSAPQWGSDASSSRQVPNTNGSKKLGIPKGGISYRRPFGSRDVNVDSRNANNGTSRPISKQNAQQGSAPSMASAAAPAPTSGNPITEVQGVVRNAWSTVVNAATSTTPSSSSAGGFHVFDETSTDDRKAAQKQTDDLVTRTSNLVLRNTTSIASPPASSGNNHGSAPVLDREPVSTPLVQGNVENDVAILNNMIDRITTVLDIVSGRSYSHVQSDARSLVSCNRGGPAKWVSRYVDYTSKYGLGYLLNDGSSGVYFNDSTKTILEATGENFQYIERKKSSADPSPRRGEPVVVSHRLSAYPNELQKKVTLLKHFRNYLVEQQQKADGNQDFPKSPANVGNSTTEMTYLKKWVRTKHAIFFRLSDQTVQIVFYDHTEVLLTPDERYVTFVDRTKARNTYFLTDELVGCNSEISKRLKYTKEILQQLVDGTTRR